MEEATQPSARKRRRQAYSKLIRAFLQKTRDRLETIRDVIKDERELHFQLGKSTDELGEKNTDNRKNEKIIVFASSNDDNDDNENQQFANFASTDSEYIGDDAGKSGNKVTQQYLTSLFNAIGYRRITTVQPNIHNEMVATHDNIVTRYLVNPLLSVWQTARERFNFNGMLEVNENENTERHNENSQSDDLFRINLFANGKPALWKVAQNNENSATTKTDEKLLKNEAKQNFNENNEMSFSSSNSSNLQPPLVVLNMDNNTGSVIQAINDNDTESQIILFEIESNGTNNGSHYDENMGAEHANNSEKIARHTDSQQSTVEVAALAFQNAFYKHSNHMVFNILKKNEDATETTPLQNGKDLRTNNEPLINANLIVGSLIDDDTSHIQVVPPKHLTHHKNETKAIEANDEVDEPNVDVVTFEAVTRNDSDNNENANTHADTNKSFGEQAAVLALEILGTIVGQTWQALRQIPNYFNNMNMDSGA